MIKILNEQRLNSLPSGILFDTDNTLYPYHAAHKAAVRAIKSKFINRFSISASDFETTFAAARTEVKSRLGGTASSHSRLLYMQRMLELLGLGSQIYLALDFEQTYWRTFLSNAALFKDVKGVLDDARALAIPTAIVTDLTAQIQFRKIVYFGLDDYFDFVVTSEEAGFDKPHAAPFQLAVEKMKILNRDVWMIGDNLECDIAGANIHIGAITFHKTQSALMPKYTNIRPDVWFSSYSNLRSLIKKLAAKNRTESFSGN